MLSFLLWECSGFHRRYFDPKLNTSKSRLLFPPILLTFPCILHHQIERQSSRLANQRRTASSQGKPLPSTRSAHTASPLTPFQNHSHSPAFPLSERERERERHNTFTNDLSINTAEVLSASQSHRTTPDQRAQSPGIASRSSHISATRVEEKEHTLCSDTSMTALTVIDLESLSGRWASSSSSGNETGCVGLACDLEENLSVTFSGGEDSLGGLQIHFLHAARGAHAHFQIMFSSQKSQMPYSVFLRKLPSFTPSNDGSIDDDLCSIAHLQISLNNSIGHQNADISDFGLGRFRGSSSSIPISILMHRLKNSHEDDGSKKMEMENIDDPNVKVYVTVLIGGQPIGGRQPLIHTDVLDSASLSGSSSSSLSLHVSHTVALHSLGISGSHILLVDRSTIGSRISSPEQCSVLSGPRYLFIGDGVDGINGVVAQAICSTFSEFKILKRDTKGIRMRRGEKYDNADSSVGSDLMGDKQNGTNYVIEDSSVLVADILALMLLIQSQVIQITALCFDGDLLHDPFNILQIVRYLHVEHA